MSWWRTIRAPLSRARLKNLLESSFSRASPTSGGTAPHMLVTKMMFFNTVSPQSWRKVQTSRLVISVPRLLEIR